MPATSAGSDALFDCLRVLLHAMLARWQATHVSGEEAEVESDEDSGWQRFLLSLQKSHTSLAYGALLRLPVWGEMSGRGEEDMAVVSDRLFGASCPDDNT